MTDAEPRIGLFWGLPNPDGWILAGVSSPFSKVKVIGGFRTHPRGHLEVWPYILRRRPDLRGLEYEDMPRGRVNWVEEGDRFLLLLDRRLLTKGFTNRLLHRWWLPVERTDVMTDPHYRKAT